MNTGQHNIAVNGLPTSGIGNLTTARVPFAIVATYYEKTDDGYTIFISEEVSLAANKADRKMLENAELPSNACRWAAAGAAVIVQTKDGQRHLVLLRKDSGAPSYAGCDTLQSGLSNGISDMRSPISLALAEVNEELYIGTPKGRVSVKEKHIVATGMEMWIVIESPYGTDETMAITGIDPKTNGFDCLYLAVVPIDYDFSELTFGDLEPDHEQRVAVVYKMNGWKITGEVEASYLGFERMAQPVDSAFASVNGEKDMLTPVTIAVTEAIEGML